MDDDKRQQGSAYQDGYHDFQPGQPKLPCPYSDPLDRSEWDRGWTEACAVYLAEDRE